MSFIHHFEAGPRSDARRRCCCCMAPAAMSMISCRSAARLSPGAALLSPRGKVLENGMPRFFRRFAEGEFDEADVVASRQ